MARIETVRWVGNIDGHLVLIDQTRLPVDFTEVACTDVESVWQAIRELRVRGAPAIGIAAAYGICVALRDAGAWDESTARERVSHAARYLATSRPTAVNLFWALERMERLAATDTRISATIEASKSGVDALRESLLAEARRIHEEDRVTCHAIGRHGAELVTDGQGVLTHCNAGGLATAEYGTALSVFFTAQDVGKQLHVFVDETRPLLQGARLTAWELAQRGIRTTLICDSMAAQVMREGKVSAVFTGADRIAANGDTANKIGTYSLAVLARAHGIPFYVAAPLSTFDFSLDSGDAIPIEQRPADEITRGFGRVTAPDGIGVYNPAFDVTPGSLITALITERGVIHPVTAERIREVMGTTITADPWSMESV